MSIKRFGATDHAMEAKSRATPPAQGGQWGSLAPRLRQVHRGRGTADLGAAVRELDDLSGLDIAGLRHVVVQILVADAP